MQVRRFAFHLDHLDVPGNARRVFSDAKRVRRKRLLRRVGLVTLVVFAWMVVFFQGVAPVGPAPVQAGSLVSFSAAREDTHLNSPATDLHGVSVFSGASSCEPDDHAFAAMAMGGGAGRLFAHVPMSLDWTHLSLEKSCGTIGVLVTDWITIKEEADGFRVDTASADTRLPVEEYVASARAMLEIMPRLQLDLRPVDTAFALKILDPQTAARLLSDLRVALTGLGASGACVDYSAFPRDALIEVKPFLQAFAAAMKSAGMRSCMIVEGDDATWIEQEITRSYDQVIVKLFAEPWVGSAPAPLSENAWFADSARHALAHVGRDRLVVAIGNFAEDWETGVPIPRRLSYGEVMSLVAEADSELSFNPDASGSYTSFRDANGKIHKIWMQDAASAYNQISELQKLGITNIAIWSLGREDPGLWPLLGAQSMQASLHAPEVTNVLLDDYIHYRGSGAALRVVNRMQYGFRTFEVNEATGRIVDQSYQAYPRPYVLERYGQPAPNELVLTFDDGPDPEFTPRILEILRETETPATFFVLGKNVMHAPETLREIVDEGHEIGTHSFSHPRMDKISSARTALEHDLAHRVVTSATGHDTILYREPFLRSRGPISSDRVRSLETVQSSGSIIYGMDVVPKDWLGRTSDEIASYVIEQVEQGAGNVILLHDAGGDRSESIKALPIIISELRARGYVFKSTSEVLGIERSVLMPPVGGLMPVFDRISFAFAARTTNGLVVVFWFVLAVGLCRTLLVLTLAIRRKRHKASPVPSLPKVAVVIPALNEAGSIGQCIESVLGSDYPNLEVVVVDDGSTDNTLNEVLDFKFEKNVRLISQPNQGKWSALNRAIMSLDAEVAVCIDADTQVRPDAISRLAEHFANPKVGAVAGKIVVGNPVNLLTRMQSLEYVTAQNFDRLAFDHINGILVVPGAIGAWRVSAVRKAGLFCQDTMTEDADLTVSVNRAGYQVVYEDRAVAHTEAPRTVRALLTQRLRWSLGMFQSAWKHKRAIFEGRRLGLVAIPDMLIFGYLFPLLAPVADLLAILAAYGWLAGGWTGDVGSSAAIIPPKLLWAYLTLPALEFAVAAFAVLSDKTARVRLLWVWPLQRVLYRPLLYLTVFRAVLRAMTGTLAVWGRTKRQGQALALTESPA